MLAGLDHRFLDMTQKAEGTTKIINWTISKLKISMPQTTLSRRWGKNPQNGRQDLQITSLIRDLYPKRFLQLSNKKITKKMGKIFEYISPKKI